MKKLHYQVTEACYETAIKFLPLLKERFNNYHFSITEDYCGCQWYMDDHANLSSVFLVIWPDGHYILTFYRGLDGHRVEFDASTEPSVVIDHLDQLFKDPLLYAKKFNKKRISLPSVDEEPSLTIKFKDGNVIIPQSAMQECSIMVKDMLENVGELNENIELNTELDEADIWSFYRDFVQDRFSLQICYHERTRCYLKELIRAYDLTIDSKWHYASRTSSLERLTIHQPAALVRKLMIISKKHYDNLKKLYDNNEKEKINKICQEELSDTVNNFFRELDLNLYIPLTLLHFLNQLTEELAFWSDIYNEPPYQEAYTFLNNYLNRVYKIFNESVDNITIYDNDPPMIQSLLFSYISHLLPVMNFNDKAIYRHDGDRTYKCTIPTPIILRFKNITYIEENEIWSRVLKTYDLFQATFKIYHERSNLQFPDNVMSDGYIPFTLGKVVQKIIGEIDQGIPFDCDIIVNCMLIFTEPGFFNSVKINHLPQFEIVCRPNGVSI